MCIRDSNVINYKEQNVFKEIKETCPEGVNVYFDNVGGKIADDVISNIAPFARIGVCGVISQYNLTQAELGQRVQRAILTNQASIEGFLVFRFEQRYNIAIKKMSKWLQEGKIIWKEDIVEGIENAPKAEVVETPMLRKRLSCGIPIHISSTKAGKCAVMKAN